ncbi:MAG: nucleotidyl transferase AbiEii/AbiGii toxin family protein [Bacteroidales bacterium]|nr:nucleotidyl transferase AbiEii/AbiGii toxin family protein [Candidatus Aminicenantes bacterium]MBN2667148.1 nucleotidyl transferase AbiEii/AbiGii toxin family protein [Bacteroidales bacterium]
MERDYYQNILYPLQDKVFGLLNALPVDFYLTGGTALSRAWLNHRYSDDLDFFLNGSDNFKIQTETVIRKLPELNLKFDVLQADEGFARLVIFYENASLKIDFVNDIPFRTGIPVATGLYRLTDTMENILSNKISALPRFAAKDLVDVVFICHELPFGWNRVIDDAFQKDMWVNPVEIAKIIDDFPVSALDEINWINTPPEPEWFRQQLDIIVRDIIQGNANSLRSGK